MAPSLVYRPRPRRTHCRLPAALTLVAILIMSTTMTTSWAARWELLIENAGIASMHTAVTRYGSAVLLDRTNIGASEIALPKGVCRDNPQDQRLQHDCTAHSVLLSLSAPSAATATVRPLKVQTDTWCSSGQFTSDGTLWQTGGDFDGLYKIRSFAPCPDSSGDCDWVESDSPTLQDARWYATNQLLPDGATQVVVGGRGVTSLEYVPDNRGRGKVYLDLLAASGDAQGDNMYPFVHLLPDGTLFVFANRDSVLYDPDADAVVRRFPTLPGEPRNYPSAGSSVLLPLVGRTGFRDPQVLVCGGAQYGAFLNPAAQLPASETCGRISPLAGDAADWAVETMPVRRTMGDMVLLPSRDVLIINGARTGSQGWGDALTPALDPVLYNPSGAPGARFRVLAPAATVPRMYHSTANLLPDARVLVAGSNPHQYYTFDGDFPTELRVEAFSPDYLDARHARARPDGVQAPEDVKFGADFAVRFRSQAQPQRVEVNLLSAPFTTHSFSMGQRLVRLAVTEAAPAAAADGDAGGAGHVYTITATAPPNGNVAPPSYYMLFVVSGGIPSVATWVRLAPP